ncbi:MAG: hypothetical protein K2M03_00020 [Muribaculaceae bacterium]|nr:hypothetical protein [Muribaculaceae bacterium]
MKKSLFLIALGGLVLASCSNSEKLSEDSVRIADLTEQYKEATNFNDSLMLLMSDIYTGLDSINQQEGLLYSMSGGEGVDRRAEIRKNLSSIKSRLAANKKLLEELESKAAKAGQSNAVLTKTIAQLKEHIAQQDMKIEELTASLAAAKGQIDSLNTRVAQGEKDLEAANAATEAAQAEAVAAENAANRVYYAIGTNKELKENGLLEKKFLGRTKVLEGDFNANYFVTADKRQLQQIPTNSKKVEIKTNMPADSYEIVGDKNAAKTIKITNPNKFWSLSPYLIIQVD